VLLLLLVVVTSPTRNAVDRVRLALCRLSQELELKQHALQLHRERIRSSESAQLAEAIAAAEAEEAAAKEEAKAARERKAAMVAQAKVGASSQMLETSTGEVWVL
jgi:hypothetical protein